MHVSEGIAWAPLIALIVALGVYPGLMFKSTDAAVGKSLATCLVDEKGPTCPELADQLHAERGK
jgi:NADH:ubiquinone oxidoreductase subunit 4 (subunit M)